jgi:MFS family permease
MALNFTKRQWSTLIIIGLADFFSAICISLQAPFFPKEAEAKGAKATEYGFVFGIFELVVFLVSPPIGQYLDRIGAKLVFNAGIFTTGGAAIVFGLLGGIEGRATFIGMAFFVRVVEALGNAAFLTASFAIIAQEFPDNVATTFATLETFFGLGLVAGPLIGGCLYDVAGYYLPFLSMGLALLATAVTTIIILPAHVDSEPDTKKQSIWSVLKIPGVLVAALAIAATSASMESLAATLEPHLRPFNLKSMVMGLIFVINGAVYALLAPFWGWLVDKWRRAKYVTLTGCLLIVLAFFIIGPVPIIPMDPTLPLVTAGLFIHGLGMGAVLVSSFGDALSTAIANGMGDNLQTYGLISGLWTASFAFGAFLGPSISGALYDTVGFRAATIFIIVLHVVMSAVLVIYLIFEKKLTRSQPDISDEQPLIEEPITQEVKRIAGRSLYRRAMSIEATKTRRPSIIPKDGFDEEPTTSTPYGSC